MRQGRWLTGLAAAVMGILGAACAPVWAQEKRPNILYIMADDHASHALSCYGSKINQTPNLDRLAAQGMRFENAFVTNALCGPSRACVLTGKYNHLNGFMDNGPKTVFDGSQQTFPKLLQKAGYQTAIVGKWHLNSNPTGFDHWSILVGQGRYFDPVFITNGKREVVKGYVTDIITDKALDFLKNRKTDQPFCLMYHHKAPHREWNPDEKHAHLYDDHDIPLPETFYDNYEHRGTAAHDQDMTIARTLVKADYKVDPPAGLSGDKLTEWKYQRFIKDYLRVIASLDDNVGRVLDYLDQNGLTENTIVVYTSDNGFFLGDHGWFDKRFMYEQSLRVPLIVRYPAKVKARSIAKQMTTNVDYAETFVDYAGVEIPADMQGRSLRPILEGTPPADWRNLIYYHYYEFPQPHHVHPHLGVRTDRYKLMYFTDLNEYELYDLQKDPNELRNVYLEAEYTEARERMTAELARARKQYKDEAP
jgi:arylsulfatase A-like enzyme